MPELQPEAMTERRLDAPMRAYRIGDLHGRYKIFSGEGAVLVEGRWHRKGQGVIYASEHYSTAMLEKLAAFSGLLPHNQHYIEIEIPAGTSYEVVTKDSLPKWIDRRRARKFGSDWFETCRCSILVVPSYVARMERNVLINPNHPDSKAIKAGLEEPVWWDDRLTSSR